MVEGACRSGLALVGSIQPSSAAAECVCSLNANSFKDTTVDVHMMILKTQFCYNNVHYG